MDTYLAQTIPLIPDITLDTQQLGHSKDVCNGEAPDNYNYNYSTSNPLVGGGETKASVRSLFSRDVFPDSFGPTTTTLRPFQVTAELFLRVRYRSNERGPHLTTTGGGSMSESPLRMSTVSCFSM